MQPQQVKTANYWAVLQGCVDENSCRLPAGNAGVQTRAVCKRVAKHMHRRAAGRRSIGAAQSRHAEVMRKLQSGVWQWPKQRARKRCAGRAERYDVGTMSVRRMRSKVVLPKVKELKQKAAKRPTFLEKCRQRVATARQDAGIAGPLKGPIVDGAATHPVIGKYDTKYVYNKRKLLHPVSVEGIWGKKMVEYEGSMKYGPWEMHGGLIVPGATESVIPTHDIVLKNKAILQDAEGMVIYDKETKRVTRLAILKPKLG